MIFLDTTYIHYSLQKLQIVTIGYVVDFDSFDYSGKLRLIQILTEIDRLNFK